MYRVDACPCCGSRRTRAYPAIVSPFLAHYALECEPCRCSLLECELCTFRFFDVRLSDEEVGRLYGGYRGGEYFRVRHRYEPWYTRGTNDGIASDRHEITVRKRALELFLEEHGIATGGIERVLDYGGDRGQFIPQSVGRAKFVFELSEAVPVAGVERIGSEGELAGRVFDFLMLCGVLEHCPDPGTVLEKVRMLGNGPQSLFFIAVPFERYGLRWVGSGAWYRRYVDALLRVKPFLTVADFWSTVGRSYWDVVPPLGVVKCHEHLNFFNQRSMTALLRGRGFEVVACQVAETVRYPVRGKSLYLLARRGRIDQEV